LLKTSETVPSFEYDKEKAPRESKTWIFEAATKDINAP